MAENVRVVVRCRPMNQKEKTLSCKGIVEIENGTVNLKNPNDKLAPSKNFKFDNTYDSNSTTESLYNDICYALVENVLEGYNGTIFAYGQTGCGKSHTMQGQINTNQIQQMDNIRAPNTTCDNNSNNNNNNIIINNNTNINSGIIPRSFDHIFEAISVASAKRYLVLVSYLEIYNETIRDLLKTSSPSNSFDIGGSGLQLKEIPGEGIIVTNLSTHTVHNAKECDDLLKIGTKNRIVGSTLMNASSSRSHSIFTISLEQIDTELVNQIKNELNNESEINLHQKQNDNNNSITIKKGKLNLVDLAGSERQNKTGASGDRLKEATKINLSLSALGNVISALVDGKTKHIPYRDSKLTRLLQDSLGGNTKTLMIACISPADYNYDETLSTLRYANRAKNIHNQPKINEDPKDTKLREYQEEINKLRKLLEKNDLNVQISINKDNNNNINLLNSIDNNNEKLIEMEKEKLKAEYETEANRLRKEYELQQKEKEEIIRDMELLKSHYKNQLKDLQYNNEINNNNSTTLNLNDTNITTNNKNANKIIANNEITQQEALNRIEIIKNALIGGERSNDTELKEKRYRKKIAAQRRLSALAHALSRVEQSSDRDLLQEHYSDIQQELKIKNDALKSTRQQIKALEREVTDLQSEFQLDRADYLETIRRLERNLKFYQQLFEKALPILRKDGKYWDPVQIQSEAVWNDDLQIWKLPEYNMTHLKLPPAAISINYEQPMILTIQNVEDENDVDTDICKSYFRPRRSAAQYNQQRKGSKSWKDITKKNLKNLQQNGLHTVTAGDSGNAVINSNNSITSNWLNFNQINKKDENNSVLASWLPPNHISVSKTWYDLSRLSAKSSSSSSYWNKNNNISNSIRRDSISSPSITNKDYNYQQQLLINSHDSKTNQRQYTSDSEDFDVINQKNKHLRSPKFF